MRMPVTEKPASAAPVSGGPTSGVPASRGASASLPVASFPGAVASSVPASSPPAGRHMLSMHEKPSPHAVHVAPPAPQRSSTVPTKQPPLKQQPEQLNGVQGSLLSLHAARKINNRPAAV